MLASNLSGTLDDALMAAYTAGLGSASPSPNVEPSGTNGRVSLVFDTELGRTEVDLGGGLETGYVVNSISDSLGIFPADTVDGDFIEASIVQGILKKEGMREAGVSSSAIFSRLRVNSQLGLWISPDGNTVINIGGGDFHDNYVENNPETFGVAYKGSNHIEYARDAMNNGWTRVRSNTMQVSKHFPGLRRRLKNAADAMVVEGVAPDEEFMIAFSDDEMAGGAWSSLESLMDGSSRILAASADSNSFDLISSSWRFEGVIKDLEYLMRPFAAAYKGVHYFGDLLSFDFSVPKRFMSDVAKKFREVSADWLALGGKKVNYEGGGRFNFLLAPAQANVISSVPSFGSPFHSDLRHGVGSAILSAGGFVGSSPDGHGDRVSSWWYFKPLIEHIVSKVPATANFAGGSMVWSLGSTLHRSNEPEESVETKCEIHRGNKKIVFPVSFTELRNTGKWNTLVVSVGEGGVFGEMTYRENAQFSYEQLIKFIMEAENGLRVN